MVTSTERQALRIVRRLFKQPRLYFQPCGGVVTQPVTWVIRDMRSGGDRVVVVDASPKAVKTRQMMKEMMLALLLHLISDRLHPVVKQKFLADVLEERNSVEEPQYDFIGCVKGVLNGTITNEGDIRRVIGVH